MTQRWKGGIKKDRGRDIVRGLEGRERERERERCRREREREEGQEIGLKREEPILQKKEYVTNYSIWRWEIGAPYLPTKCLNQMWCKRLQWWSIIRGEDFMRRKWIFNA